MTAQRTTGAEDSLFKRQELEDLHVPELRDLAREEVGSGTWIAHAKKHELIDAILEGQAPESLEAEHKYLRPFPPSLRGLPVEEAEDLSHELLRIVQQVASREVHPLRKRMRNLADRIEELESQLRGSFPHSETPNLDPEVGRLEAIMSDAYDCVRSVNQGLITLPGEDESWEDIASMLERCAEIAREKSKQE